MKILRYSVLYIILMGLGLSSCDEPLGPLDLHFTKDYQVRNFYNSSVILSELKLANDNLEKLKEVHRSNPGCDIEKKNQYLQFSNSTFREQESYIELGRLYNYAAIDLDIKSQSHKSGTASALLSLYKDEDNRFLITQGDVDSENKELTLEIYKNGKRVFYQVLSESGVAASNTLRVHLTGKFLNVLLVKDEEWVVLGSFDVSEHFELREKALLEKFSVRVGARLASGDHIAISKLEQYLTCGTAQADPKILHYEDGSPIIEGNDIWVAMTTRGYGTQLYQGIYNYNLKTKEWKVSGTLVFNKGDGLIRQWSASDVFYNRIDEKWKIYTVSHRDDHMLYAGETADDPRFGLVEIACSKLKYQTVGNEEDPSVIYDEEVGKWRMAICKANDGYETILMESDTWDGRWAEIGAYKPTSSTGVLIQKIGDQRYIFIGRGDTPCPLEVLNYPGMEKIGALNLSEHPVGKNIWPAIIPVSSPEGTAYYLLTFDRDAWTGPRTYGNIHWYYAEEYAKGFIEYEEVY